jgi:hypothetical protein
LRRSGTPKDETRTLDAAKAFEAAYGAEFPK